MRSCAVGVAGLLLLGACGDIADTGSSDTPGADQPAPPDRSPTASVGVVERVVDVTLTEGTNLALAVDPVSGDRVISLQGTLFLLPADGGKPKALTDAYYDAREPQFSADGMRVVFQGYRRGNWDLWVVGRDGSAPESLTDDPFDDREPQFSSDGASVVFSSDRSGRYDVWRLDLGSGALSQLTWSNSNAYAPSVSSDGRVAYAEDGAGGARLMLQSGKGPDKLLVEETGTISGVQWAPDGARIAYHLLGPAGAQLKVINVAQKVARSVSAPGADVFPFKAAWLNDGRLAYTADGKIFKREPHQAGEADAPREEWPFAVNVSLTRHDYARRKRDYDGAVEHTALGLNNPVISNDGEQLYFSALGDLWHWQPGTATLERLTDDAYAESSPALSPDGATLAYVVERGNRLKLVLLDLASGTAAEPDVEAGQLGNLAWSGDGSKLGFFVDVPGNPLGGQLLVMDIASGETTPVLEPMPAQPVSFSGDGGHVAVARLNPYSSRYREGVYELVVADLATGTTRIIAPDAHRSLLYATLSPDGAMHYVQGGLLYRLELDENFEPLEKAVPVTRELTDMPAFSANGEYAVYMSGRQMKRMHAASHTVSEITPHMSYHLDVPDERYILRGARIFTGIGNDYLLGRDLWINGDRIERIAPVEDEVSLPVVDVTGRTIVPGLFEMHAHMGPVSETQGRVWLSYGITTVRDPGSSPYLAKERQEAWDSGRRAGPRTHITGYLTDGNRVYYSMAEGIISDEHLERALSRTEQLELDFIKTYVRLPDYRQKRVVEFAHGIGIPVSSHELYPAVAYGADHVEHIGGTSRRGYQPKVSRMGYSYDDVVTLLTASGMGMTATAVLPGFAVIIGEEPDWFDSPQFAHFYGPQARAGYEMMLKRFGAGAGAIARANGRLLKTLTERGALLVTGTDSPFVPYGAGLHAEFRLYARAGIAPADIIRQATLRSAQAAGVAEELGTIEAGKLADLVVLDGDPLARIGDLDNVVMTVKNGRRYPLDTLLVD